MNASGTSTKLLAGAVVLLLGAGTLHRLVRQTRASTASAFRPLNAPLSNLPRRLGPYVGGRDVPLIKEVLQIAGVDSFVNRKYVDPVAGRFLQLYVGYWGHENLGMGHGPEVCYPAAGWQLDGTAQHRTLEIPGVDGLNTEVPITVHHFTRAGALGTERRAVAFLAVVDGQFRASSMGTFLHAPSASRNEGFLAHVQVLTPVPGTDWEAADARVAAFMGWVLPHLSRCLFDRTQDCPTHSVPEPSGEPA